MKRLCAMLMAVCILFSLVACKEDEAVQSETTLPGQGSTKADEPVLDETKYPALPIETTAINQDIQKESANPADSLVAVSLTPQQETHCNDKGDKLFTYFYQNILIHMPDAPDTATVISDYFLEKKAEADTYANTVRKKAQWDGWDQDQNWSPYTFELKYAPTRLDTKLLSFSGEYLADTGDARPDSSLTSVTFSAEDGSVLTLSDILTGDEMADVLCTMLLEKLAEQDAKKVNYLKNYTEIVQQKFDLSDEGDENWYFTDTGITFYFSPNEIADDKTGPIDVEFSYTQLRGIIKKELMPKEPPTYSPFSVNAARKDQIQTNQFNQVLTVTCDENGDGVSLFAGATLYNVSVKMGHWTLTNKFVDDKVLLAANRLTEKDLLLIYAQIPDVLPNLRLSASCGDGQTRSYYVFQSGKDGSIILIDQV